MGTNVRLPKMHNTLPEFDFESSRSPAKSESWNKPSCLNPNSSKHFLYLRARKAKRKRDQVLRQWQRDPLWTIQDHCGRSVSSLWCWLVCFLGSLPRNMSPCTGWFKEECNTSITMSQRSRAGIPSMRKPASTEITSDSDELWETEVCFLHIQLMFDFRGYTELSPRGRFRIFKITSTVWVLEHSNSAVLFCIFHMAILYLIPRVV